MAWAAATAPLDGTELLLAAWPAEMTTMCLPVAAGREVESTLRLVPLNANSVAAWALAGWSAPLPPLPLVVPVDVELLELQAAIITKATAAAAVLHTCFVPMVIGSPLNKVLGQAE